MAPETKDTIEVVNWIVTAVILITTAIYIYLTPMKAVRLSQKLEQIKGKEDAKRRLFFTLFSYRGITVEPNFISGLNTIDIIFQDVPVVIAAWHALRDSYNQKGLVNAEVVWGYLQTDLLSKMALSLGYSALSQIDIMNYYYPQGHATQKKTESDMQIAQFHFYNYGAEVYKEMLEQMRLKSEEVEEEEHSL